MSMKAVVAVLHKPDAVDSFFRMLEANAEFGGLNHGLARVTVSMSLAGGLSIAAGALLAKLTTEGTPDHPNNPLNAFFNETLTVHRVEVFPLVTVSVPDSELKDSWQSESFSGMTFDVYKRRYGRASQIFHTQSLEPARPDPTTPTLGWSRDELLFYAEETESPEWT